MLLGIEFFILFEEVVGGFFFLIDFFLLFYFFLFLIWGGFLFFLFFGGDKNFLNVCKCFLRICLDFVWFLGLNNCDSLFFGLGIIVILGVIELVWLF